MRVVNISITRLLVFLIFFSSYGFKLQAQSMQDSIQIRSMASQILSSGMAYENLRKLCKDVGPRLSGSPQAAKAVKLTADMLRQAGADTVYLQDCMVPHWVRGAKEKASVTVAGGEKINLNVCAIGDAVGTGPGGIKGEVIEIGDFAELEKAGKEKLQGRIVFFNYKMNPDYISTFFAYRDAVRYRGSGASMAAKYGAKGVVVRSMASNIDDFPHTGALNYNDSFPRIPAVAISTLDAEKLSKLIHDKKAGQFYFETNCKMMEDVPSHNVIGELKGSEFPDEVITVGGHLDSWDLAEGAHDDGAGCVQSIEVLNVFHALGIRPKRTIRIVMFMNEENGLRGGTAYAAAASKENKKFVFALESDAGGFTPRGFMLGMKENQVAKVRSWISLFLPYGVYQFTEGGGGADIGPLRSLGTAMAGLSPDTQRYFDIHHAATDVFEAVSRRELLLGAVNMAALVYLVDQYGL